MWFIYTIEYKSVIKIKDMIKFASELLELENIHLNEVTRPRRKYMVCTYKWVLDVKLKIIML